MCTETKCHDDAAAAAAAPDDATLYSGSLRLRAKNQLFSSFCHSHHRRPGTTACRLFPKSHTIRVVEGRTQPCSWALGVRYSEASSTASGATAAVSSVTPENQGQDEEDNSSNLATHWQTQEIPNVKCQCPQLAKYPILCLIMHTHPTRHHTHTHSYKKNGENIANLCRERLQWVVEKAKCKKLKVTKGACFQE